MAVDTSIGNWGGVEGAPNPPLPPGMTVDTTIGNWGNVGGSPGQGGNDDVVGQFMHWLQTIGAGGGPPPGMGAGGGMPMLPGMDPLGMGMGGDALGMGAGGMINPMSIGLNPYQAAGLRLQRRHGMNQLNQAMANAHRGVGRFGGRDYSTHVQNIDDRILALQEQKVQDNIKNALAYNQQLMQYAQQNSANNAKLSEALKEGYANIFRYGGIGQGGDHPGTFSPDQGSGDTQGTLP